MQLFGICTQCRPARDFDCFLAPPTPNLETLADTFASVAQTTRRLRRHSELPLRPKSHANPRENSTPLRFVSGERASVQTRSLSSTEEDRRSSSDRRDTPTRGWDSFLGFHRRERGRRAGEGENIYVDSYSHHDVALTVSILALNILDAFFTLRWLGMGGAEGNPLMDMLIRGSTLLFLLQKCVVVGLWLVILIVHKNFRIARYGMWGALALYTGILFYHIALQAAGPPPPPPFELGETFGR